MSGTLPTEIGNMSNLQQFDIRLTQITGTIPNEISKLSKLETLLVVGSLMSGEIGGDVCELKKLKAICAQYDNPDPRFRNRGNITCGCIDDDDGSASDVCNCERLLSV